MDRSMCVSSFEWALEEAWGTGEIKCCDKLAIVIGTVALAAQVQAWGQTMRC